MEKYATATGSGEEPDWNAITEDIVNAMIDRELIRQYASERGIELDQTRLEETLNEAALVSGSREALAEEIETSFGWEFEDFVSRLVEPMVLMGQVNEALYADADWQQSAREQVDGYRSRIEGGESLMDVFAAESASGIQGGDWGYMRLEEMPEDWQSVVPDLPLNTVSEVIELPDAFSLLTVNERVEAGEDTQYAIQAILVRKRGADEALEAFRQESRIWKTGTI